MAPVVHGLEDEYFTRMKFSYLDIDDPRNDPFKSALGFRYQPHFLLLDGNGNILEQWVGSVSAENFRAAFEAALDQ